jgi:hypothetical protein
MYFFTNIVRKPLSILNEINLKIYSKNENICDNHVCRYLTQIFINSSDKKIIGKQFDLSKYEDLIYLFKIFPTLNMVHIASIYGCIQILDWFWQHKDQIEFKYSYCAIDHKSLNGHINVIEWFNNHLNI